MVKNWTSTSADDDATVQAAADVITVAINNQLAAKGYTVDYIYLNDASEGQQVFQNYPAVNVAKLQSIRAKYSSLKIYTNLVLGGWKVENV